MRMMFICTSIEPKRDGVGDYTLMLVLELIRQGHEVSILSLNDKYCQDAVSKVLIIENIGIPIFRIPSAWSTWKRFQRAELWINVFDPELLSLQFVIFGYHPKGLPFGIHNLLLRIGKNRRWHIMFHELWVGSSMGASLKHILWGLIQKRIIQLIIKTLKPDTIHTHSHLYLAQLNKIGYSVQLLPLFTNIPVLHYVTNIEKLNYVDSSIVLVTFGTLHPGVPVEILAKEVAEFAKENRTQVVLNIIGHCGAEWQRWVKAWTSVGIHTNSFGEQSAEQVSELLGNSTIGISTSAFAMIEKSGTVAAMRAHGLPIICVSPPWKSREVDTPKPQLGIMEYLPGNFAACISKRKKNSSIPTISDIATKFSMDIDAMRN